MKNVIVFHESPSELNTHKYSILNSYLETNNAIKNNQKLIHTTQMAYLSFDLFSTHNYRIIIAFDDTNSEYQYPYVELVPGITFGGKELEITHDLLKLYQSQEFSNCINNFDSDYQSNDLDELIGSLSQGFNLEKMIRACHGLTWTIRKSTDDVKTESMHYQLANPIDDIIVPSYASEEMINGFVPHILNWYKQSNQENHKHLIDYVLEYYKEIPEYLKGEFKYISTTEELRIEYFSYIYHLVVIHQLQSFNEKDKADLNKELDQYLKSE